MDGKEFPWLLDAKVPTIQELQDRVIIAESEAKAAKEAAMAASEAAADAQQAAAEAGERLRMIGQLDLRIAKDVRTNRIMVTVAAVAVVVNFVIALFGWCLR